MKMSQLLLEIRKIVREEIQLSLSESKTSSKELVRSSSKAPVTKKVHESLDSQLSSLSSILGKSGSKKIPQKASNSGKVYSKDPVFNDLLNQTSPLKESMSYHDNESDYEEMPYNKNAATYVSLNENSPTGGASILDSTYANEFSFLRKDYSKLMNTIDKKKSL